MSHCPLASKVPIRVVSFFWVALPQNGPELEVVLMVTASNVPPVLKSIY